VRGAERRRGGFPSPLFAWEIESSVSIEITGLGAAVSAGVTRGRRVDAFGVRGSPLPRRNLTWTLARLICVWR
jgi:hypothetical protein